MGVDCCTSSLYFCSKLETMNTLEQMKSLTITLKSFSFYLPLPPKQKTPTHLLTSTRMHAYFWAYFEKIACLLCFNILDVRPIIVDLSCSRSLICKTSLFPIRRTVYCCQSLKWLRKSYHFSSAHKKLTPLLNDQCLSIFEHFYLHSCGAIKKFFLGLRWSHI